MEKYPFNCLFGDVSYGVYFENCDFQSKRYVLCFYLLFFSGDIFFSFSFCFAANRGELGRDFKICLVLDSFRNLLLLPQFFFCRHPFLHRYRKKYLVYPYLSQYYSIWFFCGWNSEDELAFLFADRNRILFKSHQHQIHSSVTKDFDSI